MHCARRRHKWINSRIARVQWLKGAKAVRTGTVVCCFNDWQCLTSASDLVLLILSLRLVCKAALSSFDHHRTSPLFDVNPSPRELEGETVKVASQKHG